VTALGIAGFALPGLGGSYWTTFFAPMLVTGIGMALTVSPLTTSVLGAVDASQAGVASGVNNTAARVGTVLAVAVCGLAVVWLYGRALERRLDVPGVPASVARTLMAERGHLADVVVPDDATPAERAMTTSIAHEAFLASFRGVNLFCAALALLGAAIAAATIHDGAATSGPDAVVACTHLDAIADPTPAAHECAECRSTGDAWVHLRMCLTCGRVGCCDGSKNQHATKHFWATGHPIVRSIEPGEDWRWCYVDEIVV
jgi:hypothetical protein